MMSGKVPGLCSQKNCDNEGECGLHVWIKDQEHDDHCYIMPGCKLHNATTHDFKCKGEGEISWLVTRAGTTLVPAPLSIFMYHD